MLCDSRRAPAPRCPPTSRCRTFGASTQARPGASLRARACARAAAGRCGRRAHDPALRRARRSARPAAADPAVALVHALESVEDVAGGGAAVHGRRQRRPALVPARLVEGAADRARYRRRASSPARSTARGRACARSSSDAIPLRRASRRSCARRRRSTASRSSSTVSRSTSSSAAIVSSSRASVSPSVTPCRERKCLRCSRRPTCSSTTWRRVRRTRSYTKRQRRVCRSSHRTRCSTSCSTDDPLSFERDVRREPGRAPALVRLARRSRPSGDRPRTARTRDRAPLGGDVGGRDPGGGAMSGDGTVLHLQKVAGISGSEAHLLSLLPRLRERGWDVRMLMLHEHEPGAWEFARELTSRGVPLDAISLARRRRPDRVSPARRLSGTAAAADPAHASRACRRLRAARGTRRRACRCASRRSTASTSSARAPDFALGDRAIASLAHVHIAISRGLARYLEEVEGFDGASFEIVHYGIEPDGEPRPYAGDAAARCSASGG